MVRDSRKSALLTMRDEWIVLILRSAPQERVSKDGHEPLTVRDARKSALLTMRVVTNGDAIIHRLTP
jgi:hypothetical protein